MPDNESNGGASSDEDTGGTENDTDDDLDEESIRQFVSKVNDEFHNAVDEHNQRIAQYGSLMVSLRMVANKMQDWTNEAKLPTVAELNARSDMLRDALDETPTENLNPESDNEFDQRMSEIVAYAEELVEHLEQLKEARKQVDRAHKRVVDFEREFELLRK